MVPYRIVGSPTLSVLVIVSFRIVVKIEKLSAAVVICILNNVRIVSACILVFRWRLYNSSVISHYVL